MGTQFNFEGASQTNMKAFIVLFALVAAAMAEAEAEAKADPALLYAGAYGAYPWTYGLSSYGYPYNYGYGLPYAAYAYTGCHNAAGAAVPCAAHNVVKIAKREAEAEADPAVFYAGAYGGYPWAYGLSSYGYGYGYPYTYTYSYGLPTYTYGAVATHVIAKREAEAEAEADPAVFYRGAYGGFPWAYGLSSYGYGYPYTYGYGLPAYTYGAVATHVIAKREADSEADPAYFVSPYLAQYGFPRTYYGNALVHTSRFGICTNYLGAQVSC